MQGGGALIFGCPHGPPERGMGSAIGQAPGDIEMVTRWLKRLSRMRCIVTLTPISPMPAPRPRGGGGGADAVSLISTLNAITPVDLDAVAPVPAIDSKGTHGGICGPAVTPTAPNMTAEIARRSCHRHVARPQRHRLGKGLSGLQPVRQWLPG